MEEDKLQENAKLQIALKDLQQEVKETRATLIKEKEIAKNAAEEARIIREVPVVDTAPMDKLTAKNNKLMTLVSSLEKKINETEKKFEETSRVSEERLKQAMKAESKIFQLSDSMQRLADKLSDMEAENQVLRQHQQTLLQSAVKRMSEHLSIPTAPTKHKLEYGHHNIEVPKVIIVVAQLHFWSKKS